MEYAEYGDIVDYDKNNGIFKINKYISQAYTKNKEKNEKIQKSFNELKYYKEKDLITFSKQIALGLDYFIKMELFITT